CVNGKDFTLKPYKTRRDTLEKIVNKSNRVNVTQAIIAKDAEDLENFFEEAVAEGFEGLMVKSIAENSIYQAGARGWLWIKYKRDYKAVLTDTLDLTVVGAFHGRGKRTGVYGALLLAAYDAGNDLFPTVCKCGTGFTDENLKRIPEMLKDYEIPQKHGRVDSQLKADVWFVPQLVIEVVGAEITLSPIHNCGRDIVRKGSGLAVRFPRFTGKYRSDKKPEDSSTVKEIAELYRGQLKKIVE
ncbi:MAG: ATP-dependent DNA ligase, partial [Candidatus Bathyarchaeota archaeon]